MKRKHLNFQFKVVNVVKDASEECIIEGYANTSDKDRVGDVVLPSAFEKSLPTYLSNPVLLANHDWNDPCGLVQHAEITDKGLFVRARISDTRPDIKTMIREGVLRTFSIGYNEGDADFDEATQTKFIKELELLEISIVTVPANAQALFNEVGANLPKQAEREDAEAEAQPKPQAPAPEKSAPQVRSATDLMSFIADVKSVIERDLSQTEIDAVGAYFINEKEEVMTRAQLIALLKQKSIGTAAPAPAADAGKAPPAAAPAEEKPAADAQPSADLGKMLEACMARLDALSQAVAQLLEMAKADASEDASEDKPAEDKPADKPAEDKPADDASKSADEEMSDEELQKSLDEVEAQIAELEDEANE
jgi:HK97 family phage prohead protease